MASIMRLVAKADSVVSGTHKLPQMVIVIERQTT